MTTHFIQSHICLTAQPASAHHAKQKGVWRIALVCLAVGLSGSSLAAQSVVQLPSVRQFSYQGGVLVPDGGTVFLGGNRSAAMSSSSRGLPGIGRLPGSNQSSRLSSSGVSASVTIIDLNEMDREILGYDPQELRRGRSGSAHVGNASGRLASGVSSDPVSAEQRVINEIAEAKALVRNARSSLQAGKPATAKHTYQLTIDLLRRHEQANDLLVYARSEYNRAFPVEHTRSQVPR